MFNPATGEQQAQVLLAGRATSTPPWPRPRQAFEELVAGVAGQARQGAVRVPRTGERPRRRTRRADHRRARQGAPRRAGRGAARPRGGRVRLRHPAPAQGRVLRPGLRRRRRLLLPRAARRRRRASPRSTSRPWCRCGCTRSRSPAATRSSSSRASATRPASLLVAELWQQAGSARRRLQRRARRQGSRRRAARLARRRRGLLRRLDADRALHPPARHRARQAGAGARRREEPRDRAAGRRHRLRRRPLGRRGVRLGR